MFSSYIVKCALFCDFSTTAFCGQKFFVIDLKTCTRFDFLALWLITFFENDVIENKLCLMILFSKLIFPTSGVVALVHTAVGFNVKCISQQIENAGFCHGTHGGWTNTWKNYFLKVVPTYNHPSAANFWYWITGAHHWLSTHFALYSHRSPTNTEQNISIYGKYSLAGWLSSLHVFFLERKAIGSKPSRSIKIFAS